MSEPVPRGGKASSSRGVGCFPVRFVFQESLLPVRQKSAPDASGAGSASRVPPGGAGRGCPHPAELRVTGWFRARCKNPLRLMAMFFGIGCFGFSRFEKKKKVP